MPAARITVESVLNEVTRDRLFDLARAFGARLRAGRRLKAELASTLSEAIGPDRLAAVLRELGRDELRAVCRAHDLPDEAQNRDDLIRDLARAAGVEVTPPRALRASAEGVPAVGQIVAARGRQWLVQGVVDGGPGASPLLQLACLDDDAPGRRLDLLWDLEIGARVVAPEAEGLGSPSALDVPRAYGAYLRALEWSTVSAADPTLFQAPFRAGIKLMTHQLTPLMKAIELPRANLFIADDVGLGKTIEAGLVLQELILRQQAAFTLIVCPAAITLQWRDEMLRRFGLRFEVMTRRFVARRRIERGFGVNPWATHNRFIISHALIRRSDYRDPLLAHIGERAEKGLLILDEAHVAAPASARAYATDSDTTRTLRDLAPKFDNRLFLSATPHNGHSNSFSALLEILDPIRFSRAVSIDDPATLAPVMVRRLKRDLRRLGVERYPERILVRIDLSHHGTSWRATEHRYSAETGARQDAVALADELEAPRTELDLEALLERYTELCAPGKGRGRLVFVNLQKRLLSSPEAFARTLEVHAQAIERQGGVRTDPKLRQGELALDQAIDPQAYGESDEDAEARGAADIESASRLLADPDAEAKDLLERMRAAAAKARRKPDAKALALLAWLRANCCPAIGDEAGRKAWSDRRVIIFTEYGDTKRYLQELLSSATAETDQGESRIAVFHGGMGDAQREELQQAFNFPPADHPVRILIATDAAREGVNLQAHCADLFHYDIPWNPSRMEQRNGRIDRTLQPEPEVRCHYFVYSQRREDRVLEKVVEKIETVQRQLGSVGAVIMQEMESVLDEGIDAATERRIEKAGCDAATDASERELETQREERRLRAEIELAGQRLERSREAVAVEPDALRGLVDVGLRFSGTDGLQPGKPTGDGRPTFLLPELDASWQRTLDVLRRPRGRDEDFWDWRKTPPRPVTFEPLTRLTSEAEQLHLAHPLVRRLLDRFLAQGYGAHDLSRVCAVVVPDASVARVVAYARLTLFGRGAARLHDEIIAVAAPWPADDQPAPPYKDKATAVRAREVVEKAMVAGAAPLPKQVAARALEAAPRLFAALWPYLEAEADARATAARNGLLQRARKESDELTTLLERQRTAMEKAQHRLAQMTLDEVRDKTERRQVELDREHLERRAGRIDRELAEEPAAIAAQYDVTMTRHSPVGLVLAYPESST